MDCRRPRIARLPRLRAAAAALWLAAIPLGGWAQNNAAPDPADPQAGATAQELYEGGMKAFKDGDYAGAERQLGAFVEGYAQNPDATEAVRESRAPLALCKVKLAKFADAVPLIDGALNDKKLPGEAAEELRFLKGICHIKLGEIVAAQHAFGQFWQNEAHDAARRREALILFGTGYLMASDFPKGAAFFQDQIPVLEAGGPAGIEAAGRAKTLLLHALLEAGDNAAALDLIRAQFPRLGELTQIVSFQSLALKLGSQLLEDGDFHGAIACLQRIWKRDRLLRHQRDKLGDMRRRRAVFAARPNSASQVFQLDGTIKRIEREIANFEGIAEFDAALRLRLASAFRGLDRYREAGLILADMLESLPPGPVLEGAAASLVQCWLACRRWDDAAAAADAFLEKFGGDAHPQAAMIRFLKAQALFEDRRFPEAARAFAYVPENFPDAPEAPRADFMAAMAMLSADQLDEARLSLAQFPNAFPKSDLKEDAFYWEGMAMSFAKDHLGARGRMAAYAETYPSGQYEASAAFRHAFSTHALAMYDEAVAEFSAFLEAHPAAAEGGEAKLLRGDALYALGRIDEGTESYRSIDPAETKFYEDGYFKIGKALKLLDKMPEMQAHFEAFVDGRPGSGRMPEAVYWIGQALRAQGDEAGAEKIYWDTVAKTAPDPDIRGAEDLLEGMARLYTAPDEARAFAAKLDTMIGEAHAAGAATLELRLRWARALALERTAPKLAEAALSEAATLIDPKIHSPRIIADCADARRATGFDQTAEQLYLDLRKWHPRAIEKDRAFAGLGMIEEARGNAEKAADYYARFEKEAGASPMLGEILRRRASAFAGQGKAAQAREILEDLLGRDGIASRDKALALLQYGDLLAGGGEHLKASAYFERIYLAYGKHRDLVARAYLRRGEALEAIGERAAAAEVYRELAGRDDLAESAEAAAVKGKLESLGEGGGEGGGAS